MKSFNMNNLKQFFIAFIGTAIVAGLVAWLVSGWVLRKEPLLGVTGVATSTAATQRVFTVGLSNSTSTISSLLNDTKRSCAIQELSLTATDTPNFFNDERLYVGTSSAPSGFRNAVGAEKATSADIFLIDSELQKRSRADIPNFANQVYFNLVTTTPASNATIGPVSRIWLPGDYLNFITTVNASGSPEGVARASCSFMN